MKNRSFDNLSPDNLMELYTDCSENSRMYSTARRQGLQVFYSVVVAIVGGILLGPEGTTRSLLGGVGIIVTVAAWLEERRWNGLQYFFMDVAIEIEEHLGFALYSSNPARQYDTDPLSAHIVSQVMFGIVFVSFVAAIVAGIFS